MENILQSEIDTLIKRNNELIEAKKTISEDIQSKLVKGNIIFDDDLIADTRVAYDEDGRLIIKVLVHPNFRINEPDTSGIPSFDYGCAFNLVIFPLQYLSQVESLSIEEYYWKHKEEVLDGYVRSFDGLDKEINRISNGIERLEQDIIEKKKCLEKLKNRLAEKDTLIQENTEQYLDKVKKILNSTEIDEEAHIEHNWHYYEKYGWNDRYVCKYGFDK